jgi:glycerol-3-phosphate acyltransferase PlsX
MGGDHGPSEVLQGALLALLEFPITLALVGPEDVVQSALKGIPSFPIERVDVVHAPDIVGMAESPTLAFRKKKNSSIQIGLQMVKEGRADAFVSAGNTGAVMAASLFTLGRISGVERPAIASVMPSQIGPFVMLDMGSTVDCKPQHLAQFGVMGTYFSQLLLKVPKPRVALLNIGEEPDKGNAATLEAHTLLQNNTSIHFIGNIEGKDILQGKADVVVCDGFVGNALLKFGEGVTSLFTDFFKAQAKGSILSLIGLLFLKPALKRFMKSFDYQEYGGAPLLGVDGVSIIAHGKSKRVAIKNAIRTGFEAVEQDIIRHISEAIRHE